MLFSGKNYILNVNLKHQIELYDKDDYYPLDPEIMKVTEKHAFRKTFRINLKIFRTISYIVQKISLFVSVKKNLFSIRKTLTI